MDNSSILDIPLPALTNFELWTFFIFFKLKCLILLKFRFEVSLSYGSQILWWHICWRRGNNEYGKTFFLLPTSSPRASWWPVFENVATSNQTKQSLQYKYQHSAIFPEDVSVKTLKIRSPADFSLLPSSSLSWYWCDRLLLYHYDKNNTWFCMIACNAYMTPLDL